MTHIELIITEKPGGKFSTALGLKRPEKGVSDEEREIGTDLRAIFELAMREYLDTRGNRITGEINRKNLTEKKYDEIIDRVAKGNGFKP